MIISFDKMNLLKWWFCMKVFNECLPYYLVQGSLNMLQVNPFLYVKVTAHDAYAHRDSTIIACEVTKNIKAHFRTVTCEHYYLVPQTDGCEQLPQTKNCLPHNSSCYFTFAIKNCPKTTQLYYRCTGKVCKENNFCKIYASDFKWYPKFYHSKDSATTKPDISSTVSSISFTSSSTSLSSSSRATSDTPKSKAPSNSVSDEEKNLLAVWIGGAFAILIVVLLIFIAIFVFCKQNKSKQETVNNVVYAELDLHSTKEPDRNISVTTESPYAEIVGVLSSIPKN